MTEPQRVLLVDDRPSNLMALQALLEALDCEITVAESGEEALQRLLVEEFDVILLDVQLPGLDGFEVAELIKQRERTRHVPLIFLTATTGSQTALRGYSAGAVDFVSKPFDPVLLRSKVQAFLELSRANRLLRRQADELAVVAAEREAAATLLQRQAEELQRSNTDLADLAAMASHDLAEPLRVIAGYSQLLREHTTPDSDPEVQQITGAIERGVERMQRLIDGMLAYARAGADATAEDVPLSEVTAEVLLALEARIAERDADVQAQPLPVVRYNRTQLTQVMQNLISNAIKFVPPGRTPTVRIAAAERPEGWEICVSDNGIGVSPEERDRLLTTSAHRIAAEGGLGLALCARIAERNGGRLDVAPGPDGGSVFSFVISRRPSAESPIAARDRSAGGSR